MRTHLIAIVASVAALGAVSTPAQAQGLGSLFACNNPNSNNRTGAVVGGLLGALAGSQVAKNERTIGAVVGAGLGAAAGNYFGCRMGNDGRNRAQTALEQALNTGRSQTWSDTSTGTSGRIDLVNDDRRGNSSAGDYGRPVSTGDLRYARGVQRVYNGMNSVGPEYIAESRVNLRAAPTTSSAILGSLTPRQTVRVAGEVDGWLAVERNGQVQGYASGSALRPAGQSYQSASNYDTNCRTVVQTVSTRGYADETQRFQACRDGSGQWRIDRA